MKRFVLLAGLVLASGAQAQSGLTATWFANNPAARQRQVDWCNDNPGPARRDDNCAAAWQAQIIAAQRETRAYLDRTPPSNPQYWLRHPHELPQQQTTCDRLTDEADKRRNWCDSSERAARMIQQRAPWMRRT